MGVTRRTLYALVSSPVGPLLLSGTGGALERLAFVSGPHLATPDSEWVEDRAAFAEAERQLEAYFAGGRRAFDLELAPRGSEFQLGVWSRLRAIPYGATMTYGELARDIGSAGASRAVGLACGANPIGIIVPCHRVIGAGGRLTGFGGGLPIKARLLAHERGERELFDPR